MHIIGKGRVLILKKFGIVCVLMALLCCIMAPNASAREVVDIDRSCSLTVSLRSDIDFDHEFLLYQLFDVDSQSETGDVHFVVNEEYRDCVIHALNKIGVSDIQEDNLAQTVLNVCNDPDNKRYDFLFAIRKSMLDGSHAPLAASSYNKAVFDSLSVGIYFIMDSSERVTPGLILIPCWYDDLGYLEYNVRAELKVDMSDQGGVQLPATGGTGIYDYIAAGFVLLAVGVIVFRKKRVCK